MKRVEILWQDALSLSEWRLLIGAGDLLPMTIQTLGYLLEETEKRIVIVSQVEATERDDRICADVHIIPRGGILSIKEI
ncbi:unnamed protein product [marine sediment metagenome]|uniref:Uncharacterized protein n=1 Tax=marine sediment metagenome TaxID=412755 RepID=X1KET6_9ZZZZ